MKWQTYLKTLSGVAILTLAFVAMWFQTLAEQRDSARSVEKLEVMSQTSVTNEKALEPADAPPADLRARQIVKLDRQIQDLRARLQNQREELEQKGFPKVLQDLNLGEQERSDLLGELAVMTDLQIRLTHLKIQKIDLETSVSL